MLKSSALQIVNIALNTKTTLANGEQVTYTILKVLIVADSLQSLSSLFHKKEPYN